MKTIELAVIENQTLVRSLLIPIFQYDPRFFLTYESKNGLSYIQKIDNTPPDLVLVSSEIRDISVIDFITKIKSFLSCKIVCLDYERGFYHYEKFANTGVDAIISVFTTEINEITNNLYLLGLNKDEIYDSIIPNEVFKNSGDTQLLTRSSLSKREQLILRMQMEGLTSRKISQALNISLRTVETHRRNMYRKTKTNNSASLVAFALKNGLLQ